MANVNKKNFHTQQTFTCSKATIETLEKGLKYVVVVDIIDVVLESFVNLEHMSHFFLVFPLLTLNR